MSDGWQLLLVAIVIMVLQSVKHSIYSKLVGRKNGKLFQSLSTSLLFLLFIWWQGGDVFLLNLWLALLILEFGVLRLERDFGSIEEDVQACGWLGLRGEETVSYDLHNRRETEKLEESGDDVGAAGCIRASKMVVRYAWWAAGMAFAGHFFELGIITVMWSRVGFDFSWFQRGDVFGTTAFVQLLFFYMASVSCLMLQNKFQWYRWKRRLVQDGWNEGTSRERLFRFCAVKPRADGGRSTMWLFLISLIQLIPIFPLFVWFCFWYSAHAFASAFSSERSNTYHEMWWPDRVSLELASEKSGGNKSINRFITTYARRLWLVAIVAWYFSIPALFIVVSSRRLWWLVESAVTLRKRFRKEIEHNRGKVIVINEFAKKTWVDAQFGPLWNNLSGRPFAWWSVDVVRDRLYSNGPFAFLSNQFDASGHVALMIPPKDNCRQEQLSGAIMNRFQEVVNVPLTIMDVWEVENTGIALSQWQDKKDSIHGLDKSGEVGNLEYLLGLFDEGILSFSEVRFMESFVGRTMELNDRLQDRFQVLYRDLNGWRYDGGVFDLNVLHRRVHEFPEAASRFLELLNVWELVARWMVIVEGVEEYEQEEETLRISFGKTCADVRKTAFMQSKLGVPEDGKLMEEVREYWKEAFNWTASMSQNPTVEEAFGWMVYIRNKTRGHGSTSRIKEELYIVVEALTFLLLDRVKDHADLEIMVRDVKKDGTVFFTRRHGMRLDFMETEDSSVSSLVGAESDVHFRKVGEEDWRNSNLLKAENGHVFLLNEIRKGHREWVCFSTGELIRPASIFDA